MITDTCPADTMVPIVKLLYMTYCLSYLRHFSHMYSLYITEYNDIAEETSNCLCWAVDRLSTNFKDIPRIVFAMCKCYSK